MGKRLLMLLGLLTALGLLLLGFGGFHTRNPELIARVLLASWKASSAESPAGVLWATPPAPELSGFDLSVGRQASGHGIAMLQRRSRWYAFSREVAFSLIQSSHDAAQWQLAESRCYTVNGRRLLSWRFVRMTLTDSQ